MLSLDNRLLIVLIDMHTANKPERKMTHKQFVNNKKKKQSNHIILLILFLRLQMQSELLDSLIFG